LYGDHPHYTDRKQVERLKNEFVSLVSHELRTPLTSIHGALRILASGLLSADSGQGKRLLQIAVDSTDRLVDLINDILDVERIESGSVKMNKTRCNSVDIVAQAVQLMQPIADRIGATLSVSNPEIELVADSDRIVQVLTNLLSNAIKFSPFGSTVWLSAERQPDRVLFTVKDEGCGIPTDKLGSIFDRFQQADSSDSRHHDGTGLGLTICRSVVQQHQGQIWVESVVGQGSTFCFTLPLLDSLNSSTINASIM
jgi:signal transduction histidine kinase